MRKFLVPLILCLLTGPVGCRSAKSENSTLSVPYFRVQCDSNLVSSCSAEKSGSAVWIGLLAEQVDCQSHFSSQPENQSFFQINDASGSAPLDYEVRFLVAEISEWKNWAGLPVTNLPKGTYTSCAFIDLNNDQRWTPGEPYSESLLDLNFQSIELKDWR